MTTLPDRRRAQHAPHTPVSSPAKAGDPVRRGLSVDHRRLRNTGSSGQAGRWQPHV